MTRAKLRRLATGVRRSIDPPRPPHGSPEKVAALSATPDDEAFITGNGIAARCRHVINFDEPAVNEDVDNDWWFCKADYLEYFFRKHAPETPFVLFTHNSDRGIDKRFLRELDRDRLVAWFAQNPLIDHPKLRALPLGLANPFWPHGDQAVFRHVQEERPAKTRLFDVSFSVSTNPDERTLCIEQSGLEPEGRKPYPDYVRSLAEAWFCLAPAGYGVDTVRTWESLYLRTIPVVTRSVVAEQHRDLPLVILDDWRDFGSVDFSEELYRSVWGDWDPAALRLDRYFAERVEPVIERLRRS